MLNIKNYNIVKDLVENLVEKKAQKPIFIAVTKGKTLNDIEELIKIGHIHFGENRLSEAEDKYTQLKQKYPHIVLHFIGTLQSNKVKKAVELFDVFHTIDSKSLIEEFVKYNDKIKNKQFFIQLNIAGEPQKGGVEIEYLAEFLQYCNQKNFIVDGLMCIPPLLESDGYKNKTTNNLAGYFALNTKIAKANNLQNVSMGMSSDFDLALKLGATHIRVGSFLFN